MTDLNQPARNFMPTQFRCVISFVVEEKGAIDWQSKKPLKRIQEVYRTSKRHIIS